MRDAIPSPEQARREYHRFRHLWISSIKNCRSCMLYGVFIYASTEAKECIKKIINFKHTINLILANKDSIYISKQVMENLQEDAAWLEKVRAEAEAVLNS